MKVLTEVDVFTATVSVPEGTDSRNDAADVVEDLSQALANRTKHLNEHSAKIDEANTFSEDQAFLAAVVINSLEAVNVEVTNDADIAGDLSVDGGSTLAAATVTGNLGVGGSATVTGGLTAATLDAGADVFAGDDVIATGDFQYGGVKSRSTYLNMFRSEGQWVYSSAGAIRHKEAANAGDANLYPICLPHGATITEVRMLVDKAGSGAMTLRLYKKTANGAFSAAPSEAQVGATDTETGSGVQTLAVTGLSEVVDLTACEYYAFVIAGDTGDIAYQIRVQYQENAITYPGG